MVRAKFKCESTTLRENNTGTVTFRAVSGGSQENLMFWKFTPAGAISLHIDNEAARKQFQPGQEYYVDFTSATPVVAAENQQPITNK